MTYSFAHSDRKEERNNGKNSEMEFTEFSSSWLYKNKKIKTSISVWENHVNTG